VEENIDHIILIKNFTKSRVIDYYVDIDILLIARLEKGGIMLENKKYIALGLILLVGLMTGIGSEMRLKKKCVQELKHG
jgi:hypothetical protein